MSGSVVAQRGTSVAAPLAARCAVDILVADRSADVRKILRCEAMENEKEPKKTASPEHPNRIGAGRLGYDIHRTPLRREEG